MAALHLGAGQLAAGKDGERSRPKAEAEEARSQAQPPDVKDTHARLDRIYQRLGIKRVQQDVKGKDDQGCGRRGSDEERESRPPVRVGTPAMPAGLGYLLLGLILVAMLIPLYLALRSGYGRSSAAAAIEPEPEERPASASPRSPWQVDLAECRRLAAAGRLPEAFAALHRATLLALERSRHLALDETTTNWEYVRRLASRPALRQTLAAVTLAAEQSVLGQRPPGLAEFHALERDVLAQSGEVA